MTKEIFDAGTSRNGAWSIKQLRLLDIQANGTWPAHKGWKHQIIGSSFSENIIEEYLSLKDKHLKSQPVGNLLGNNLFTEYEKMNLDFE